MSNPTVPSSSSTRADVRDGTAARFTLLGALYFAQGLPFGFFVQALPVLLRKSGVSLSTIGFTSLLTLPWALKFLWAPVVDTRWWPRLGRRRSWILAMQVAAVLVLTVIAATPGSDRLALLMIAMFVLNSIAATQDIATDGLAVELLPPAERGLANGLQVAGYRVGMIVGGGVLLGIYDQLGHHGLFAIMAGLTAVSTVPVLMMREPPTVPSSSTAPATATATPAGAPREPHFLQLPGAWRIIALVVVYKFGEASAQGMLRPFLVDRGLGLAQIAWIIGTVGFVAGMLGALVGGALVGVFGRLRALIAFGVGQVISVLGYAYLAFGSPTHRELYVWAGVEHFASGMATAALFTAMMDWSRPSSSGTDYTVQASAVVIATGIASTLAGASADTFGYGGHFLLTAALCVIAVIVVWRLFPRSTFPRSPFPPVALPHAEVRT
jgi:RhtX/FptX family siderophore transporter